MKHRLPVYTLMHFLVDLTCIYRLYVWIMPRSSSYENWILLVVLYNFLAFALPGLVGLIADYRDYTDDMAALGCLMIALPVVLSRQAILSVALQGIGNGFFHVGVGRRVLMESEGKYAPAGIFISSGAMGVFLGTFWRREIQPVLILALSLMLLICAGLLLCFSIKKRKMLTDCTGDIISNDNAISHETATTTDNAISNDNSICNEHADASNPVTPNLKNSTSVSDPQKFFTLSACMILLVVVIRSFYGTAVHYDWKNTFVTSFLFACCIVAGKACGGILSDRIGVKITTIISLGGAALTVAFSRNSAVLGCISILLFNMTMPLTLSLLADLWKAYPGFAFGILMLALFIGTIPDLVVGGARLPMWGLCLVALVSLVCLLLGISGKKEEE